MSIEGDRRAQGATRIPFDALVEVGGALGPSFEAQAVNVSRDGIQLRTAYLPELGQQVSCRFDAGPAHGVLAAGEVVWANESGKGGEFGIRFTDMDPESVHALRGMCGLDRGGLQPPGTRVRLHIEGLSAPMRAKVRESQAAAVTVGSDLGFLQVGKELELEDAESGTKRPARIDKVDVDIDPESQVPQLVVTLRYAEEASDVERDEVHAAAAAEATPESVRTVVKTAKTAKTAKAAKAAAPVATGDLESLKQVSEKVKGRVLEGARGLGEAISRLASRTKTTVALLAAKRRSEDPSARRTTSPAPAGSLRSSGRRVVRSDPSLRGLDDKSMEPKGLNMKRKMAIGGAVVVALALGAFAMKKPAAQPSLASADSAAAMASHMPDPLPPLMFPSASTAAAPLSSALAVPMDASDPGARGDKAGPKKPVRVTPFGNASVHGIVLGIKMDGMIERIQGAAQPTGFTVQIPNRKSIEAAGPLASKDPRIASIHVTNEANGAELTVAFKDGVPNYQVRAKGETLEIVLGSASKATAKADGKGHGKHSRKHAKEHGQKKPDKSPDRH
jgi:hypothetical protein